MEFSNGYRQSLYTGDRSLTALLSPGPPQTLSGRGFMIAGVYIVVLLAFGRELKRISGVV